MIAAHRGAPSGVPVSLLASMAAAVMLLPFADEALAWGEEGHAVVAEIAQRRLTPQAAAMVEKLLGRGHSLASVASWADDFRASPAGTATTNWHFVSIPLRETSYDAARDCRADPAKGDCIVAELTRLKERELRCATGEDQARALKFAVHFVADIHQPLHAVGDLGGGNGFEVGIYMPGVTCTKPDKCVALAATDLHTLWDTTLIQRKHWSWGSYVDALEAGWLKSPEAQGADGGTPEEWAVETHGKARDVWDMKPAGTLLKDEYLDTAAGLIDRQLGAAGLRLARFLSEAYGSNAPCAAP